MTSDLFTSRAGELKDALVGLLAIAARVSSAGRGDRVSPILVELLEELHRISETGNATGRNETLVSATSSESPEEAGAMVGLSGRRVRQLCAAGLVAHQRLASGRLLVDVESLRNYVKGSR